MPGALSGNLNSPGVTRVSPAERTGWGAGGSRSLRKSWIRAMVNEGLSSISQCPAPGTTASRTFVAALRMTTASVAPNDFSPPTASTGIVNLVRWKTLLSSTSCEKAYRPDAAALAENRLQVVRQSPVLSERQELL